MPISLTTTQLSNIAAAATRPIYLVQLNHSGTLEYLSCSGAVTYDGQAYTAGGARLKGIRGARSATIEIKQTSTRIGEIQTSAWRGGVCKIYYIPALPTDTPTYTTADAILVFDGLIDISSAQGESLTIQAKNKYLTGVMAPVLTVNQICNHIPPPGTVTTWEGEKVTTQPATTAIEPPALTVSPSRPPLTRSQGGILYLTTG